VPRKRRVAKRRSRALGAREIAALRGGTAAVLEHVFGSLKDARVAWESVRGDLMARCPPGTRPAAYWVLECPEHLHPRPPGPSGPAVLLALTDDMTAAHAALTAWHGEGAQLDADRRAWLDEGGRRAP